MTGDFNPPFLLNMDYQLPKHVAIIMDGNGRWAKAKGLLRTQGHIEGVKRLDETVALARKKGIRYLTVYAFSTENWDRPADEVDMLLKTMLAVLGQKVEGLHKSGVCIRFIGRRNGVPDQLIHAIDSAMNLTANNKVLTLNIAFNYGSRIEIVDAMQTIAHKVKQGKLEPSAIDEQVIHEHLYTHGQPDPDLLIRTSGEERISNFLLWQLSYAELYFTPTCWPDFNEQEFDKALMAYASRDRRWGKVNS